MLVSFLTSWERQKPISFIDHLKLSKANGKKESRVLIMFYNFESA